MCVYSNKYGIYVCIPEFIDYMCFQIPVSNTAQCHFARAMY